MKSRLPRPLRTEVRVPKVIWPVLWLLVAFWAGGTLPVWSDWSPNNGGWSHQSGSLWALVANLPTTPRGYFWKWYSGDVGGFVGLLFISGGPLVTYLLWRQALRPAVPRDHAGGPGGVVPAG